MTLSMTIYEPPPQPPALLLRLFAEGQPYLRARWLWLRALGFVFLSAFVSLWFQIHGLIGERGILPASSYLEAVRRALGLKAYWYAPSLFWLSPADAMLTLVTAAGLAASVALLLNVWPRLSIAVAGVCFLSFVAAAQEFSGYQSDGMLLEAALLSIFFAPPGIRPGLGVAHPPTRASLFALQFEWFRIWFESGVVKILSGEEQWRHLTAMDKYYENGPLPTFLGWYVQQWPHAFHAASAAATLLLELFVVWLLFFPRPARLVCFVLTTPLQIGIILTANYAFLNYLVLFLGVLLLDDRLLGLHAQWPERRRPAWAQVLVLPLLIATNALMFLFPSLPTARLLSPLRVVNTYGLFAVMTRARYEIEFQGTADGRHWVAYPFRFKPQDPRRRPGIFAPYQPRFDWNLWFASLGTIDDNPWVMNAQVRLLEGSPPVLRLFRANPFPRRPPVAVRTVLWQYWFTTAAERRRSGAWWRRQRLGTYGPTLRRAADGTIGVE